MRVNLNNQPSSKKASGVFVGLLNRLTIEHPAVNSDLPKAKKSATWTLLWAYIVVCLITVAFDIFFKGLFSLIITAGTIVVGILVLISLINFFKQDNNVILTTKVEEKDNDQMFNLSGRFNSGERTNTEEESSKHDDNHHLQFDDDSLKRPNPLVWIAVVLLIITAVVLSINFMFKSIKNSSNDNFQPTTTPEATAAADPTDTPEPEPTQVSEPVQGKTGNSFELIIGISKIKITIPVRGFQMKPDEEKLNLILDDPSIENSFNFAAENLPCNIVIISKSKFTVFAPDSAQGDLECQLINGSWVSYFTSSTGEIHITPQ